MHRTWILIVLSLVVVFRCGDHPSAPNGPAKAERPKAPLILDRRFSDGEAIFSWESDEDVVGWNVYRAEGDSPFVKIAYVSSPSFKETGLLYDRAYTYRIAGVTADGAEGEFTQISGVPRNNLYPTTPRELTANSRNFAAVGLPAYIELRWIPNEESDFRAYRVYVATMSDPSVQVLFQEVDSPRFVFENAVAGVRYRFQVSAVDRGDLESSPAEVAVEVLRPVVLESPVEGAPSSAEPVFKWSAIPGASYEISVSASPGGIHELWVAEVQGASAPSARYAGPKLAPGIYWWKVLAVVSTERSNSVSLSRLESFRLDEP